MSLHVIEFFGLCVCWINKEPFFNRHYIEEFGDSYLSYETSEWDRYLSRITLIYESTYYWFVSGVVDEAE
jgi:hypothetical protein